MDTGCDSGAGGMERRDVGVRDGAGSAGLRTLQTPRGVVARPAAIVLGAVLGLAAVLRLAEASGAWVEQLLAAVVAGCGGALVVVGRRRPAATVVTSLVVDLGGLQDAGTLERRLAEAVGDPGLRLRYRLGPGGWLDASGRSVSAPVGEAGSVVSVVEVDGGIAAALVHDGAALEDPALREAVIAAVRLAVMRLRLAADATVQAEELAASRRRLVEAAASSEQASQSMSATVRRPSWAAQPICWPQP